LKTLAVLQLHDKKGKPVAATALGRKDKLLPMLKNMRASFIERKQAKEKSVLPASPGNMDCGKGST